MFGRDLGVFDALRSEDATPKDATEGLDGHRVRTGERPDKRRRAGRTFAGFRAGMIQRSVRPLERPHRRRNVVGYRSICARKINGRYR